MRTYTQTVRVGEDVGPIDWNHPMIAEVRERRGDNFIAMLREAEKEPNAFKASDYGGDLFIGMHEVLAVCMYDGWPYWRPTPSVCVSGVLGAEWKSFGSLTCIRRISPSPSRSDSTEDGQ